MRIATPLNPAQCGPFVSRPRVHRIPALRGGTVCRIFLLMSALCWSRPVYAVADPSESSPPAEAFFAQWEVTVDWAYGSFERVLRVYPDLTVELQDRVGQIIREEARIERGKLEFAIPFEFSGGTVELHARLGLKDGELKGIAASEIGSADVRAVRSAPRLPGRWTLRAPDGKLEFSGDWVIGQDLTSRLTTGYETVEGGTLRLEGNRFIFAKRVGDAEDVWFTFYGYVLGDQLAGRIAGAEGPYWNLVEVQGIRRKVDEAETGGSETPRGEQTAPAD